MDSTLQALLAHPAVTQHPLALRLAPLVCAPTGLTRTGYPYLSRVPWERFRDTVPHLLGMGPRVLAAAAVLEEAADQLDVEARENIGRACRVVRQVVRTAAITAPPDLWLLRHVLGFFSELGLLQRLRAGEALYPASTIVEVAGSAHRLDARELEIDLHFLLSRGLIEQYDDSYRIAGHPRARRVFEAICGVPIAPGVSGSWSRLFSGEALDDAEIEALLDLIGTVPRRTSLAQNHWIPTLEEVDLGYRIVPIVLGLRAAGRTAGLAVGQRIEARDWSESYPRCASGAMEVLGAAGWMVRVGEGWRVTSLGERGFARGPGPFGIIETYHPYMAQGREILLHGRADVHVLRGENIGASQDANRKTFRQANDALDRFCADTGFGYTVFIEHAIGRGEATRQRFARPDGAALRYFGADLEDAAIDAAVAEQRLGVLPAGMVFVRHADIGRPEIVVEALRAQGVDSRGAVMVVGNGFHEVRDQSDASITAMFRGYQEAGILLLFTEESALSIDDLRATAWNTYHAGFRYLHEKSGQALRPAEPAPNSRLGHPLRASWSECAIQAGYVRADRYSSRSRSIYPYTPRSGRNPSVSVTHFVVPGTIAEGLEL